jgi:hypothetical protein
VRDRQTVLRSQFAELFMRGAHSYWIRMIINNWEGCQPEFLFGLSTIALAGLIYVPCGQPLLYYICAEYRGIA